MGSEMCIRDRYDDSSGDILYDGVAVNIPEGTGSPDGMTIDCNDNLWVAQWGGGGVYCYNPYTGDLLTKIVVPAPHVASCAFGGDKLDTLYITTARAGLSEEQLDKRILREFDANHNKQYKNSIDSLFPAKLKPVMIELSEIEPEKKVNEITKEERQRLVHLIKDFTMTLTGLRGYNEAIITKGGVSVKEIHPGTMESKFVKNLYFSGEVLDLDALTGGYNLQIAWSTGYLAGREESN